MIAWVRGCTGTKELIDFTKLGLIQKNGEKYIYKMSTLFTKVALHTYAEYERLFEVLANMGKEGQYFVKSANLPYIRSNWKISQRVKSSVVLFHSLNQLLLNLYYSYTWLVITEPWCMESAQNLPVIAAMANINPEKIRLLVVLRDQHPELMNKYLTNGIESIPKVILINETLNVEEFTWGPRPAPAQDLFLKWKRENDPKTKRSFSIELNNWYNRDGSMTIQREFKSFLQAFQP